MTRTIQWVSLLGTALVVSWAVGILGRGYWTPDEPREADISWRMSWQSDKAVPLLAGEPFCEKPPLTYWLAGASMALFGSEAWAARLPNLLYALSAALAVGLLARRSRGAVAGVAAAAALGSFLLFFQTALWLATDAPLLAAVCIALLGEYAGFYAASRGERLRGYLLMHAALALGFLCKSAAAWMVPALVLLTLVIWERRWRELLRWELYVGLPLQAAAILIWIWFVYAGPDGPAHLKVFFWNNLLGRFASIDAPAELQYAAAHQNWPGKYFLEMPLYLWPWTLLVIAAARRAWLERRSPAAQYRCVRFALATSLAPLALLSVAATARNIYWAPALPGVALLLGWWVQEVAGHANHWDARALRATAALLLISVIAAAAAITLLGIDARAAGSLTTSFVLISGCGLCAAAALAAYGWAAARRGPALAAPAALLLAYCALLIGPASQAYLQVNRWQDLSRIGRAVRRDAANAALVLLAPDETTRAFIDMYTRTSVQRLAGPIDAAALARLRTMLAKDPQSRVLVQIEGRALTSAMQTLARDFGFLSPDADMPTWLAGAGLEVAQRYALPNGRIYALLRLAPCTTLPCAALP